MRPRRRTSQYARAGRPRTPASGSCGCAALRGRGHAIGDELLEHVWPLHWEHINLAGDYTWADPEESDPERLRELRLNQSPSPTELRRAA
jgi:Tn3 transposase DDE domain